MEIDYFSYQPITIHLSAKFGWARVKTREEDHAQISPIHLSDFFLLHHTSEQLCTRVAVFGQWSNTWGWDNLDKARLKTPPILFLGASHFYHQLVAFLCIPHATAQGRAKSSFFFSWGAGKNFFRCDNNLVSLQRKGCPCIYILVRMKRIISIYLLPLLCLHLLCVFIFK